VPYREIAGAMASADLLVALSNDTRQRIPAKIYDYMTTRRPIVSIADNAELADMLADFGGATSVGLRDVEGIARALRLALDRGRGDEVEREAAAFESRRAAQRLAAILDEVTAGSRPAP
jgi:hypothetical protein